LHPDRRRRAVGDGAARLGGPQFEQTFAQAGKALPLATQIVILLGTGLRNWWWAVIAAVVACVWLIRRRLANPAVRLAFDARVLRLPLLGDLLTKVDVARFARTLSTLLGNGVTLLSGLSIVRETVGNGVLANALDGVIVRLREARGSDDRSAKRASIRVLPCR
jgi:general secretion pathway protein F